VVVVAELEFFGPAPVVEFVVQRRQHGGQRQVRRREQQQEVREPTPAHAVPSVGQADRGVYTNGATGARALWFSWLVLESRL
jgi:hypothetical protein